MMSPLVASSEMAETTRMGGRRYFMRLSYCGAPFHGWQSQPNAVSVQSAVEDALSTVLRRATKVTGAGRTDTGVNASCMWAHFDVEDGLPIAGEALVRSLNAILGKDIAVYEVRAVRPDAHARFDATSRTYHYLTHRGKSPFLYRLSWQQPRQFDVDAMNRAAAMLLKVDDFTSFAKLHSDAKTNICKVTRAEWVETDYGHTFVITADRFLRNMVRAVVGTLVDVGRGKLSLSEFAGIIEERDRCAAGTSMPPHPLYLHDITYPADIFL